MRTLLQDLRYGFRMARRSPGFTLIAVLTLAIGIAANTTVFSWIDAALVHPIPGVANGDELVTFEGVAPNGDYLTVSYPDYRDYRDHLKLLSGLAVARPEAMSLGDDEHAERIRGELVSGNYFAVLGVRPILGRFFTTEEYGDKQGGYPVAVISERLWKRRFHSDPGAVGTTIRLNRQTLTVVGVAPANFHGSMPGLTFDLWVPLMMGTALNAMPDWMLGDRGSYILFGFARLKPGVSLERARAETASVAREVAREDYKHGRLSATLFPVWKGHFGAQHLLLAPLTILMAVCVVVLLIVCANVANLLLARATSRQKELSMRMALGAGRGRLMRQLLTETLGLAMMGALAAMPLTMWMSQSLGYLMPPTSLPVFLDTRLNGDVLAFVILLCVGACLVSGVAPAWHTANTSLNEVLKEGGRSGSAGSPSQRLRGLLVVSEVALALVVLIGAALFARSFQMARQINPGFDPEHVLVSRLYLSTAGYSVPQRKLFCQRLRERLEAQPGIVAVSYADQIPLGFNESWEDLQIEGYVPGPGESMKLYRNVVAPGYFDLLRIPLLEGRDFTEHDDRDKDGVMIVTQTFARRFFGDRSPIGHKVHGWGEWFTIIGVVRDSKYSTPNEAPRPHFYVAFRQVYRADLDIAFFVRTHGDPLQALPLMRQQVKSMDPGIGVYDAMPMAESVQVALFGQKIAAALLAALGAIALVLAAVGLYGVMAYSVSQRIQEIGIRMALGARPRDVLALTVGQGMRLTLLGLAAGVLVALAVTRVLTGLLVHVSATDPLIFAGASLFLAAVALAASYLPARRATRIDPNVALRCQ
jgi:predicted permease